MGFFRFLSVFLLASLPFTVAAMPERSPLGRADPCAHYYQAIGEAIETAELPAGPRVRLPAAEGARKLEEFTELKLGAYNVLNLQSTVGRYEWRGEELVRVRDPLAKPAWAREALAQEILAKDPDFLFLEEVEGFNPLTEFNQQYLERRYRPVILRGNDPRGIEVAMLVKKDFPFDVEIFSHANLRARNPRTGRDEYVFTRDAPLVFFRAPGAGPDTRPLAALVGTHLKSQRDAPQDVKSVLKRTDQARATVGILDEVERVYPGLPVIVAGDFNADVRSAREFEPFWRAGMRDLFDLLPIIPRAQRITHTFHPKPGPGQAPITEQGQLDAMLLNRAAVNLGLILDSRIVPHRSPTGEIRSVATSIEERNMNPSDHHFIFGRFDFTKIIEDWRRRSARPGR